MKTVGVLSLQGSFVEHMAVLEGMNNVRVIKIKSADDLNKSDYLIIPGGESTTLSKLLKESGLDRKITERALDGMPVWGTCAGMILLAKENDSHVPCLGLIDVAVKRNAYGSQLDSFNALVKIAEVGERPLSLTFIRAPLIEEAGNGVQVLLELEGRIVAARNKNILVTSFHPELTGEKSIYEYFLNF